MTDKLREAAQQALEALVQIHPANMTPMAEEAWNKAIVMLGDALVEQPAEQPAEQVPVAWMPIATAPKGRIVLVYYKNSLGNGRTMRARYYLPETLDSDTTESGWADEGWYEESEAYEYLMPLEHDPTHWMPLPAAPDTAPQPAKPAEQEPVGWVDDGGMVFWKDSPPADGSDIYTAPQPAKRVPLTDDEIEEINGSLTGRRDLARLFARAIERAHGITGEAAHGITGETE